MTTIIGGWRGYYCYEGILASNPACGFSAEFRTEMAEYAFSGSITDDIPVGPAVLKGTQTGMEIEFVKSYVSRGCLGLARPSIRYTGTISEDGNNITGTWALRSWMGSTHGTWSAVRTWPEVRY